jgi:hypothetical protein
MARQLRAVEALPEAQAQTLLPGLGDAAADDAGEAVESDGPRG